MMKSDKSVLREELKYKNYKNILTIEDMRFRAKVNALAINKTIQDASLHLGVSHKHLSDFMKINDITNKELLLMREHYITILNDYSKQKQRKA